jgi:hypothetical protein
MTLSKGLGKWLTLTATGLKANGLLRRPRDKQRTGIGAVGGVADSAVQSAVQQKKERRKECLRPKEAEIETECSQKGSNLIGPKNGVQRSIWRVRPIVIFAVVRATGTDGEMVIGAGLGGKETRAEENGHK